MVCRYFKLNLHIHIHRSTRQYTVCVCVCLCVFTCWLLPLSPAVLPTGKETLHTSLRSRPASSNTCCMVLVLLDKLFRCCCSITYEEHSHVNSVTVLSFSKPQAETKNIYNTIVGQYLVVRALLPECVQTLLQLCVHAA